MGWIGFMTALALLALFCLIAVPVLLAGLIRGWVLFVRVQVLVLPFRLLGWTLGVGAGLALLFVKLFLLLLAAVFLAVALVVGLLPVLPVLLLAAGIWLLIRSSRRSRPAVT